MNLTLLYKPEPPWIFLDVAPSEEKSWQPAYIYGKDGFSPVIRVLRGNKMRTRQALMDEFGAALQFFEGFGENWYALEEVLCYLDEWLVGSSYILIVTNPQEVLVDEEGSEIWWLAKCINNVGEWWSRPILDNGRFNRTPKAFHVVLRCKEEDSSVVRHRFNNPPYLRPQTGG